MTKKHTKELKKMVEKIKNDYRPEKIYLFGSFSVGKESQDSDFDFFIIKNTKKTRRERGREVSRLLIDRKVPVDILVYTPREVRESERLGDFFITNILNTGKLLYAKK